MTAPQHQPTDDELVASFRALRAEHPDAGIAKLHALLPDGWLVSLKRARKVLQQENLVLKNNAGGDDDSAPRYRINDLLDVGKWSGKIQVRDFGRKRGKGLVLTANAWAGEVLWKEDPFVVAPEPDVQDEVTRGNLCAHCLTQFKPQSNLVISCPKGCRARFCNRLCLSRATTHPLVCPSQNPASAPLLALARAKRWQAAYALLLCAARVMLAADAADQRAAFGIYESLAFVEPSAELWRKVIRPSEDDIVHAYKLYTQALTQHPPKLLKNAPPLPPAMSAELLSEEGFRRGLARINLNLEVNGGLYALHSHLNHSCAPTVAARHMDPRTALARLAVVPLWPLKPGQELTITYVDPKMGVVARRAELQAWGIARCDCTRCLEEEKLPPEMQAKTAEVPPGPPPGIDFGNGEGKVEGALFDAGDLEKELKSHLHLQ
ncbi:hypothetical protein AURDEDRAFT_182119 [Auricularia subglabra TFB-10046 SS5]|nr:hypothetical protein AURDEDRAFT_182119 [Auricularia subglabra TFB-10046 SS5]